MNKKKILIILTAIVLITTLFTPLIIADPDNVISFLPSNIHVEVGSSTTMNINATINDPCDTVAVDNLTFNPSIVTTDASNVTGGNLFENGTIDPIVYVNNATGYINSIVWSNETLSAGTTGTLANITWYGEGVGVTEINMTAGGTAYNGTSNATTNHSCNITVHPQDPSSCDAQVNDTTTIYLTWTKQLGGDNVSIFAKNASYPTDYTDGTNIYNGTGTHYEHTVPAEEHWYYRIYSWNTTESLYSLYNQTVNANTSSSLQISNYYPANGATGISRPPTNLSADVSGTNIDAYIYFVNMTPKTDTWTLVNSWSGISSQRIEYTSLDTFGRETEFIWGNTTYTWSVNITDGGTWINKTYTFSTKEIVDGSNARHDINNDDTVDVFDLNNCWTNREGEAPFDGIYDVNTDDEIDVFDLNNIWSNRS